MKLYIFHNSSSWFAGGSLLGEDVACLVKARMPDGKFNGVINGDGSETVNPFIENNRLFDLRDITLCDIFLAQMKSLL